MDLKSGSLAPSGRRCHDTKRPSLSYVPPTVYHLWNFSLARLARGARGSATVDADSRSVIGNYENSVLALLLEGICPRQQFSSEVLEGLVVFSSVIARVVVAHTTRARARGRAIKRLSREGDDPQAAFRRRRKSWRATTEQDYSTCGGIRERSCPTRRAAHRPSRERRKEVTSRRAVRWGRKARIVLMLLCSSLRAVKFALLIADEDLRDEMRGAPRVVATSSTDCPLVDPPELDALGPRK
jgi:hypothetical protein